MSAPTQAKILAWRKKQKAGWKLAAKHFDLTVSEVYAICGHTPRSRARAGVTCASCETLRAEVAKLKEGTAALARVKGTRLDFLEGQLVSGLADLDDLRGQERTGTAISVQTRTCVEIREQLDDERHRILEADGDPISEMHVEELLADIDSVIHSLPDSLLDRVAEMLAKRYGKEPALLLA